MTKRGKGSTRIRNSGGERISAEDRALLDGTITPEQRARGIHHVTDFKIQEVVEGGKVKAKTIRVIRNRGGTAIERWHARGVIDEKQMAAVLFYQQAWRRMIGEPRVVANWSAVIVRDAVGALELYAGSGIAARETLRLLDQEVFLRIPVEHVHVWQNVVIWDQPAGVAGSLAGFATSKQSEAAAKVIINTVSRMIADLVIDGAKPNRDFEALLVDMDAPRRAGPNLDHPPVILRDPELDAA